MGMKNVGGMTHKNIRLHDEYERCKRRCENCGDDLPFEKRKNRFCGSRCSATFMQRDGGNKWTTEKKRSLSEKMHRRFVDGKLFIPNQHVNRIEKTCQHCGKSFSVQPCYESRRFCSKECGNKGADRSNCGGYRQHAGRGKSGWYKGIFCNSSWELSWVIYSIDHDKVFTRNTTGFDYTFKGKPHRYYPDFLLNDGVTFVEVKGYNTEQWKAKKEQFPHTLHIVGKDEIKPYIKYVTEKYGTDFIRLYDGNPHNDKTNTCKICGKSCRNKYCSRHCSGKAARQRNFTAS